MRDAYSLIHPLVAAGQWGNPLVRCNYALPLMATGCIVIREAPNYAFNQLPFTRCAFVLSKLSTLSFFVSFERGLEDLFKKFAI